MPSNQAVDVTITVDKANAERLDEIVDALRKAGLRALDVHKRFLVVNGSIDGALVDKLRAVKGVAAVRNQRTYKPR